MYALVCAGKHGKRTGVNITYFPVSLFIGDKGPLNLGLTFSMLNWDLVSFFILYQLRSGVNRVTRCLVCFLSIGVWISILMTTEKNPLNFWSSSPASLLHLLNNIKGIENLWVWLASELTKSISLCLHQWSHRNNGNVSCSAGDHNSGPQCGAKSSSLTEGTLQSLHVHFKDKMHSNIQSTS